jgi:hypothetical protein
MLKMQKEFTSLYAWAIKIFWYVLTTRRRVKADRNTICFKLPIRLAARVQFVTTKRSHGTFVTLFGPNYYCDFQQPVQNTCNFPDNF